MRIKRYSGISFSIHIFTKKGCDLYTPKHHLEPQKHYQKVEIRWILIEKQMCEKPIKWIPLYRL